MSDSVCDCDVFVFPQPIYNPPGRTTISYRTGTYTGFRHALLLAPSTDATGLPAEIELTNWRPNAEGDLALQMMEWWAYLADILTFYNERRASDSYLNTIEQPANLNLLIRVLGYRPRPGIGASVTLAGRVDGFGPFTLPKGFQVQSKPGPGNPPQIFELSADTTLGVVDAVDASVPPATNADGIVPAVGSETMDVNGVSKTVYTIRMAGVSTTIKKGDEILLLNRYDPTIFARGDVILAMPVTDPGGKKDTKIYFFDMSPNLSEDAAWTDYKVMKSSQMAHIWQFPSIAAHPVFDTTQVHLDSLARSIQIDDPILFEIPDTGNIELTTVAQYQEIVWYANGQGNDPTVAPTSTNVAGIPIPHTQLLFATDLGSTMDITKAVVRYAWAEVGDLIAVPATTVGASSGSLAAPAGSSFPATTANQPALVEDANGNGATASVDSTTALHVTDTTASLIPPLQALFNTLAMTRGSTVSGEILGSGDGTVAGQEFVLQKSPLTYLPDPTSTSSTAYKSTLQVWVDTVLWTEVPSFYGQSPNAQVFVTREDATNSTHVQFGDGINGARLTTGTNNVVANYRIGSGLLSPAARTLTTIVKAQPHLVKVRNPVAAGGGSDPDPPSQIQTYAPQSVLTFNRAISFDDYETIAAEAPSVARARAYFTWDSGEQRTLVKVYVGDTPAAVTSAQTQLNGAADPNRLIVVSPATPVPLTVGLAIVIDAKHDPVATKAAATAALIDPAAGLLGTNVVQIGASLFVSQIDAACLSVPGVLAVHDLSVSGNPSGTDYRFDPGEGGFFQLTSSTLTISYEVAQGA